MKQLLEGADVTQRTQRHLDRCLTCRNCETTCPSGVKYGRLIDISRHIVERRVQRSQWSRAVRWALKEFLPRRRLFGSLMRLARMIRPILPRFLKEKIPARRASEPWLKLAHTRSMLLLDGCVQPAMMPNINIATARVLDILGIQPVTVPNAECCGAIRFHLHDRKAALNDMRSNIDAWWPHVDAGAEAIIITATGCGVMVKEYGHWLRHDSAYAAKAARVSALTKDLSEIIAPFQQRIVAQRGALPARRVAWHSPCTLQHGQQLHGQVESLLRSCGVELASVAENYLCCGSAGTYAITQPTLSRNLRDRKLYNLQATKPDMILSANVGCIAHLQSGTAISVRHWIEFIDLALR